MVVIAVGEFWAKRYFDFHCWKRRELTGQQGRDIVSVEPALAPLLWDRRVLVGGRLFQRRDALEVLQGVSQVADEVLLVSASLQQRIKCLAGEYLCIHQVVLLNRIDSVLESTGRVYLGWVIVHIYFPQAPLTLFSV